MIEKRNKTRENKTRTNNQRYAKRLASYTAAAGLGAFSVAQGASAGVVFRDIPDVVLTDSAMTYAIDVDGDGTPEVHIDLLFNQYPIAAGGDVWARPEGLPTPATSILVPYLATAWNGVDYYINAFAPGATIGPLSDVAENNTYDNGGLLGYDINNFPTYNYAYSIFGAGGFLGL